MARESLVQWTDAQFSPWIGCTPAGIGCRDCYAKRDTFARASRSRGIELWGPEAQRHVTSHAYWGQPYHWNREAKERGVPIHVFCGGLCDIFEGRPDMNEHLARLVIMMQETPWLRWLLLTKRPENAYMIAFDPLRWPRLTWPSHVALGVSVSDQSETNKIVQACSVQGPQHVFVSIEPMVGAVDLRHVETKAGDFVDVLKSGQWGIKEHEGRVYRVDANGIKWAIVGGETGARAALLHPDWVRKVRDDCKSAGVPFYFKSWGEHRPMRPTSELAYNGRTDNWVNREGEHDFDGTACMMRRVGKKHSGNVLDGCQYEERIVMP